MQIKILLKGYLVKHFDGEKERIMEFDDGISIRETVKIIGFEKKKKKFGFVAVNGQRSNIDQLLKDGDELKIYPKMSGG